MKVSEFKEDEIYFSTTTQIAYRVKKGALEKFPLYAGAEHGWGDARYSGDHSHFKKMSKQQIKDYKEEGLK